MNLKNAKLGKNMGMVIVDLQNDFLAPDGAYARGNTLSRGGEAARAHGAGGACHQRPRWPGHGQPVHALA